MTEHESSNWSTISQHMAAKEKNCTKCKLFINAIKRERYRDDPKYRQKVTDFNRQNKTRRSAWMRVRNLRVKYNLTPEDLLAMVDAQQGKCRMCDKIPDKALVVDHEHRSGKVRGLLCHKCNIMLGHIGDTDKEILDQIEKVKAYLKIT